MILKSDKCCKESREMRRVNGAGVRDIQEEWGFNEDRNDGATMGICRSKSITDRGVASTKAPRQKPAWLVEEPGKRWVGDGRRVTVKTERRCFWACCRGRANDITANLGRPGIGFGLLLFRDRVGIKRPALNKFAMCVDTRVGLLSRKLGGGSWSFRKWFGLEVTSTRSSR